ncbi:uncharacterized protein HRG_09002 [Hirsutella rhossiliensis]|uniref:Uncharacterized protein n=1 Tax=Hirsutella rhossiliensis TaxID=111463 RepID=A0A9P8MTL4_9HYPO|nr:uncharacterized protein HRG_09002 [Hirsutella rhossiliensis]KAH0959981.1 hypothetical protein HRG_09002 [Hirsutella rhossiliensis]
MKSLLFSRHSSDSPIPSSTGSPASADSCRPEALATSKPAATPPQQRAGRSGRSSPRFTTKHALSKPDVSVVAKSASSSSSDVDVAMSRRGRPKRDSSTTPSLSNLTEASATVTPTGPLQIPKHANREAKRGQPTHRRRYPRHVHSTESMHPSLAALLALTDIPRHKRRLRSPDRPLIIDDTIVDDHQVSEKELSLTLGRGGPLDLLLSPPQDVADDVDHVGRLHTLPGR